MNSLHERSRPGRRCFSRSRTSPTAGFASWKIRSDTHGFSAPHLGYADLELDLARKSLTRTIGPTGGKRLRAFRQRLVSDTEASDERVMARKKYHAVIPNSRSQEHTFSCFGSRNTIRERF